MTRIARVVAVIGLGVGAITLVAFAAWSIYTRATWDPTAEDAHGALTRGLHVLAFMPYATQLSVIAGVVAVVTGALAVMVYKHRRWASIVGAIGCAGAIAAVWFVRHVAWVTEGRYAHKSPYVHAATAIAIPATVVLSIIALACVVASARHDRK